MAVRSFGMYVLRVVVFPATAAALPARTHTLLYNSIMASEEEVRVPPLLKLAAYALVGRDAEVRAPGAVPQELVAYHAEATTAACPNCYRIVHNIRVSTVQVAAGCRFGHDARLADTTWACARKGHTDCMLAAVRAGALWHPETTQAAAEGGYTECMLAAVRAGAQWDPRTTQAAAWGGHTECMLAAVRAGARWDPGTTQAAARGGHTECMLAAVRAGAPWHEETTWAAAAGGHTECMLAAVRAGARWDPQTTRAAAAGGHTECMLAAVRAGAPWHPWTTWVAAAGGHTECMLEACARGPRGTRGRRTRPYWMAA